MKHEFVNEYKNVRIRPLEEKDVEQIRNWRNDSKNTRFLSQIPYITSEMQKNWYRNSLEEPCEYVFAIDEIKELNKLVGSFSLYNITDNEAEFGKFLIGEDRAHGKSVGVNTLMAALAICFNTLNKQKVYLEVYKDNIVAIKVYEQAGFAISDDYIQNNEELIMIINKKEFCERIE